MDKIVKCSNCGGDMQLHSEKCPYCGFVNIYGAEENYMKKLFGLKGKLEKVDDEARKDYAATMVSIIAKVVIFIGIFAVVSLGIFYGIRAVVHKVDDVSSNKVAEDAIAEVVWQRNFFPKLDEIYAAGDFEGVVATLESDEAREHQTTNWEHYYFADSYSKYMDIRDNYVPELDDNSFDALSASGFMYDCLYFYYEVYRVDRTVSYHLTEADYKVLDECRSYIVNIVHERMKFTDEQMEAFRANGDILSSNYLSYGDCSKLAKKYYTQFE